MSDDAYDDQVESDAFNEEQPLDDYEATYYYTSLRTTLNAAENTWLANNMVGSDPFDHAVADFIFMTLLNADGDVKIGNNLYHFAADGSVIIVSNGDCTVFASAKASSTYTNQYLTRQFPSNEECRHSGYKKATCSYINNSNREFRWRIDFDSYVASSRPKTVARNFRKKNGSWRRYAAKTYVYIGGDAWDLECENSAGFSYNEKTKRRKRVGTRRLLSLCKIKTEEIVGVVTAVNNGAQISESITW